MTTKPIIEIKGLGKKYNISHQRGGYVALRDVLANVLKRPLSFLRSKAKQVIGLEKKEVFWALKDISFEVMPGEVIGIIGKNGAGKSTLLKILTGITPPTEGEAIMHGRVSSLLEVGTGFHPELTGRENIFLNGAILGMTQKEISQNFDEIVEFSGVGKFLDTPVKHYSSGMQVRLAFSVAAHMEPDILIVDEVLAVGDAEFQKKCMGKMEEVTKKDGRTILFVSHNLAAVQQLCKRTIVLEKGKVAFEGDTGQAIEYYAQNERGTNDLRANIPRYGNGEIKLVNFHIENIEGEKVASIASGEDAVFVFSYECAHPTKVQTVDIGFSLEKDSRIVSILYSSYHNVEFNVLNTTGEFRFRLKQLPLSEGIYQINARVLANGIEADRPRNSIGNLNVIPSEIYRKNEYRSNPMSVVTLNGIWSHETHA